MPIKLTIGRQPGYLRFELTGKRVLGEFGAEMAGLWTEVASRPG